uniref:Uncharacterized protein n=1 Tax=Cacopsylla melanoneura TaxID=428564 RepID=A0A8D8Z1J4_9HEMI
MRTTSAPQNDKVGQVSDHGTKRTHAHGSSTFQVLSHPNEINPFENLSSNETNAPNFRLNETPSLTIQEENSFAENIFEHDVDGDRTSFAGNRPPNGQDSSLTTNIETKNTRTKLLSHEQIEEVNKNGAAAAYFTAQSLLVLIATLLFFCFY